MSRYEKYSNIEWTCSRCFSMLNWNGELICKCDECGHHNLISRINIIWVYDESGKVLQWLIETIRFGLLYGMAILTTAFDLKIFLLLLVLYIMMMAITMIIETKTGCRDDGKLWHLRTFFFYLFMDSTRPIRILLQAIMELFTFGKYRGPLIWHVRVWTNVIVHLAIIECIRYFIEIY